MTRVRDVAQLAGVSTATVSNVLNNPHRVSPATAKRVREAIDELGFVRNAVARQLRAGRSRSIGLIALDIRNPFFTDLARGAEGRAEQDGLSILLANSDESSEREAAYIGLFEEQRVFGLLISPVKDDMTRLMRLRRNGIPAVLIGRTAEDHSFSSVAVDDILGGEIAAGHLAEMSRKRIAFVGPIHIKQIADRLAGASKAVDRHPGVTLEVIHTSALSALEGHRAGVRIRERRAENRPNAIFAANDLVAIGVLQALLASDSINVPQDIAIVGYDDIDFSATATVPLSSIRQPSMLMGRTAVDLLIREVESGPKFITEQVVLDPELVARTSSTTEH